VMMKVDNLVRRAVVNNHHAFANLRRLNAHS
jgi:hypothetical protein